MKRTLLIFSAMSLLTAASLCTAENQPGQARQSKSPGYEYRAGDIGPGMMGSGSGYHGRGPGMMRHDDDMGRGMRGRGRGMGPDRQGWQDMTPDQQEQWRQMRSQFMQDTLPLRQELNAKQMELETLWDQQNPDAEKVRQLSDHITQLRSKLEQMHDQYLTQCRQEFGDRGWACPGGGWRGY